MPSARLGPAREGIMGRFTIEGAPYRSSDPAGHALQVDEPCIVPFDLSLPDADRPDPDDPDALWLASLSPVA